MCVCSIVGHFSRLTRSMPCASIWLYIILWEYLIKHAHSINTIAKWTLRKRSKTVRNCGAEKDERAKETHKTNFNHTKCYYLYDLLIPLHFHLQNNKFFPQMYSIWFGLVQVCRFLASVENENNVPCIVSSCWVFVSSFVVSLMGIILMRLYDLCAEAIFDEMMNVERNANKMCWMTDILRVPSNHSHYHFYVYSMCAYKKIA